MSLNEEPIEQEKLVSPVLLGSLAGVRNNAIEKRDPVKGMLALEMLSGGETWEKIQEATGFSFDEISRVRARHKMAIDKRKEELAQDGFEMAEGLRLLIKQKMEHLANNPDALAKVNLRDLVLPYGIAVDKGMQALGENKVVIEHTSKRPSLEDAVKAIEEAKAKIKLVKPEDTQTGVDV